MSKQNNDISQSIVEQVKDVASIIEEFPMYAGIISFFLTMFMGALTLVAIEEISGGATLPGYIPLAIMAIIGWSLYRIQRDILYKSKAIPKWLPGTLYIITVCTSVPLGLYSVEMTQAAGESLDVVVVSAFFFPMILTGITYGFCYWLKYLRELSHQCRELPETLNNSEDLYTECVEALDLYERLGPEIIRSHRSSYSINHIDKFKPEYLQCVKDGITEKTIFLIIPMLNATFRLKYKQ